MRADRRELTGLLQEHISIAVDLIKFAKAGDTAAQQEADRKWHKNGEDIADFLSTANPELAARRAGRHDEQAPFDHHR